MTTMDSAKYFTFQFYNLTVGYLQIKKTSYWVSNQYFQVKLWNQNEVYILQFEHKK